VKRPSFWQNGKAKGELLNTLSKAFHMPLAIMQHLPERTDAEEVSTQESGD